MKIWLSACRHSIKYLIWFLSCGISSFKKYSKHPTFEKRNHWIRSLPHSATSSAREGPSTRSERDLDIPFFEIRWTRANKNPCDQRDKSPLVIFERGPGTVDSSYPNTLQRPGARGTSIAELRRRQDERPQSIKRGPKPATLSHGPHTSAAAARNATPQGAPWAHRPARPGPRPRGPQGQWIRACFRTLGSRVSGVVAEIMNELRPELFTPHSVVRGPGVKGYLCRRLWPVGAQLLAAFLRCN